jgi:RNA polymerase sigma factor (sigma-70 family)
MDRGCVVAAPQIVAPETDEDVIAEVRAGNIGAFDVLYERYFSRVYHFVDKRLRNRADTEETVQEVFINIFSSIDSYRGDAPFSAWVFGLTRRTIARRFKRKRHPTVPLFEDEQEGELARLSAGPTPLETYECQERLSQLEDVVSTRLTSEQWTLFRLHHMEDRSIVEIASELSKSEDSIKSNLYRTRKILLAR